ncbi:MAG: hypothetical protein KKB31_04895 [Nanoarchaeota archaeon]|nr:hypothetical protein [Nanoarchaeota archaeon]
MNKILGAIIGGAIGAVAGFIIWRFLIYKPTENQPGWYMDGAVAGGAVIGLLVGYYISKGKGKEQKYYYED